MWAPWGLVLCLFALAFVISFAIVLHHVLFVITFAIVLHHVLHCLNELHLHLCHYYLLRLQMNPGPLSCICIIIT